MAKKNEEKTEETKVLEISPITQEFGSGDMNVLRDKINELIAKR